MERLVQAIKSEKDPTKQAALKEQLRALRLDYRERVGR